MRKKGVLFVCNYPYAKTGFANYMKRILPFLYKLGKYEIALLASGMQDNNPDFQRYPFKIYGAIPSHRQDIIQRMNQDPAFGQAVSYGKIVVDDVIRDFKPDVVVGCEDPWGQPFENRKWTKKLSCISHTTIDSRPILPQAIELAKTVGHFYTWADFPIEDFKKLGLNIGSIKACVNTSAFRKLPAIEKAEIRRKFGIPENSFITGMVFRNQLRKSAPNLIEGMALFKRQNPEIKNVKLICATHFSEGWNLHALCDQYGFDKNDLLCVYKCKKTQNYFVLPFQGQDIDNPVTKDGKSLVTMNVSDGITDEQLNEVYNLMDCYCHPHTSGGAELPIFEAKLAELVTLVTNYSSGEDACVEEAKSLPLDFAYYTEIGTQFLKASTYPTSIARQLKKFYNMGADAKAEWGREARKFTLKNYSLDAVGPRWEAIIDALPLYEGDWNFWETRPANLSAQPTAPINNAADLVKFAYGQILNWAPDEVDLERDDLKGWVRNLEAGVKPEEFIKIIQNAGAQHNSSIPVQKTPEQILREQGVKEDAVFVTFKESGGDICLLTSLFKSLREQYPTNQLVISCEPKYRELLEGNPYVDLVVDYQPFMDSQLLMQGVGANKPLVFKSLHPRNGTQMAIDYLGDDKLNVPLSY